jgi:hypothetical protein
VARGENRFWAGFSPPIRTSWGSSSGGQSPRELELLALASNRDQRDTYQLLPDAVEKMGADLGATHLLSPSGFHNVNSAVNMGSPSEHPGALDRCYAL